MTRRIISALGSFLVASYIAFLSVMFLIIISTVLHVAFADDRVPIAVIDLGLSAETMGSSLCQFGHKDLTGTGIRDHQGHGSNVVATIVRNIDSEVNCVIMIKWENTEKQYMRLSLKSRDEVVAKAMWAAAHSGAKYVNVSLAGDYVEEEKRAIQFAVDHKIHVVVAAGNEHKNLSATCDVYPACYPIKSRYFHVVKSVHYGVTSAFSNYGGPVTDEADGENVEGGGYIMSGTSQATAIVTGKLARSEATRSRSPSLVAVDPRNPTEY